MDYGIAGTALATGLLFGFVLEQAGFGSPCKLTAQFRLTDWSVFKVMFTAIIVAAIGILLLQVNNTFGSQGFYVAETYLWGTVTGGMLIGAGFAIGGYCPGTSVVGLGSGRVDGLVFMLGMVIGIGTFASVYDTSLIQSLVTGARVSARTVPELLGVSPWLIVAAMILTAIAGFALGRVLERRSHGVYSAEDITEGRDVERFDAPGHDLGRDLGREAATARRQDAP
ncbi:MAG: YeeE/YedE family protein [Halothiobacillaceae bacterium]|nr:YeeE/YedE family protein [Halothiobacillaceae bacterium]HER34676.1 transporter [Halothiobacillaceae bacterium]